MMKRSSAIAVSHGNHPVRLSCLLVAFLLLFALSSQGEPLLPNGDFEQADPSHPGKPAHWDLPDGLGVRWTEAPVVPGAPPHGKALRFDTAVSEIALMASYTKAGLTQWLIPEPKNNPIGVSYGLSLYSEAVPIVPGKTYRVRFDYLAANATVGKLWFRAYGEVNGQKKRLYEGTVDCTGSPVWQQVTGVFHPTKYRPNVSEFKVMLYAYYPNGVAWFDNVRLETVDDSGSPPSAPVP